MRTVFDVLNATINYEEEAAPVVAPVAPVEPVAPVVTPVATPDPIIQEVDWSAQNLLDAGQQAEIDVLKAQVAALLAAPAPMADPSTGSPAIKRTNTYGRMFNS